MSKEMVQMGVEMQYFITADDESDITEEQMDDFMDEFIRLIEKRKWSTGGGYKLVDANSDDD